MRTDLPFLEESSDLAPLLVFSSRDAYRAFPARLAAKLNAEATVPRAGGFTVFGIATSFWDPEQGSLRPVYTHEFVHALLSDRLRLDNRGEWLHEGLASRYQLRFHPQENFGAIVADGLAAASRRLPLERLCDGQPIPSNRYWQALTVAGMLLQQEKYAPRAGRLFKRCETPARPAWVPT
ncbi:MAG: hypothetical protein M3463_04865 [Verrucomicrobiota bacterium]|nr:hypothetical protein [Verrucomicrobiota bacterium]